MDSNSISFISKTFTVSGDLDAFQAEAMERGWGDGMPLIPPTSERVAAMLKGTWRDPQDIIMVMQPQRTECTVEKAAINAVMAGCLPRYMPVVIAALEAIGDPRFSLRTVQSTTHPVGPMIMVNGPIAATLGFNGGTGALGPGWRANATIGRALRLAMQNVGNAFPGKGDMATQGSPAKYSFCFAENELESPWEPYHVSLGFKAEDSVVTVHPSEAPNEINDHTATDSRSLLTTFCETIASVGKNNPYSRMAHYFVGFCPEHAHILAKDGFGRKDVQRYLYERARIPYAIWRQAGMWNRDERKGISPLSFWLSGADDKLGVPVSESAEKVHVVVVGGGGKHSAWMPSSSSSQPVSKLIRRADGSAWSPE